MTDQMPHNVFITLRISYLPRMSLGIIHTLMMAAEETRYEEGKYS